MRRSVATLSLILLFLLSCALELGVGPMHISVFQIPTDLLAYLHGSTGSDAVVLGDIRLPRLLVGALVGACLALTGATLQAVLRNPLADPALIGVSSGGSLGAVLVMQLGIAHVFPALTSLAAFVSGLLVILMIFRLSTRRGLTSMAALLLAGVAVSSFCSAAVSLILLTTPLQTVQGIMFWLMGGLDNSSWGAVLTLCIVTFVAGFTFFAHSAALDVLALGDAYAEGAGLSVQRVQRRVLLIAALVVGACVSLTGVISFVGLIVPHVVRQVLGPRHAVLLPHTALLGASLILLADVAARTAVSPLELNVGIVTSFLGAPFFLFIVARTLREGRW